jgi:transposase
MAYSIDFIKRSVAYKQEGHTFAQLREAFDIPSATFYDWEEKLNNGYFDITIKRERRRKIDKEALKQAVKDKPDACLKELAEQFNCTPTAVHYALEKLTITRKKRPLPIVKSQSKNGWSFPKG